MRGIAFYRAELYQDPRLTGQASVTRATWTSEDRFAPRDLALLKLRKNSPIPNLLPPSVAIANKPGRTEGVVCDWAVVYVPNRPFAIAVMTTYNGENANAEEAISKVAKLAYDHFARLARSTPHGARVPLKVLKSKQD